MLSSEECKIIPYSLSKHITNSMVKECNEKKLFRQTFTIVSMTEEIIENVQYHAKHSFWFYDLNIVPYINWIQM